MVDVVYFFFFFNDTATTETYTYGHSLSLRVALPISDHAQGFPARGAGLYRQGNLLRPAGGDAAAGGHGRARPSSATGGRAAIPAQPDRRAGGRTPGGRGLPVRPGTGNPEIGRAHV